MGHTLRLMFVFAGKGVTGRMTTYVAKGEEAEALKRGAAWFIVDATDQVLGRLATRVAVLSRGRLVHEQANASPGDVSALGLLIERLARE